MPSESTVPQERHVEPAGVFIQELEGLGVVGALFGEGDVHKGVQLPLREQVELGRRRHQKGHVQESQHGHY